MSVPSDTSVFCRGDCGTYNVKGYCDSCLAELFNWLAEKGFSKIRPDNIETLWKKFEKEKFVENERMQDMQVQSHQHKFKDRRGIEERVYGEEVTDDKRIPIFRSIL